MAAGQTVWLVLFFGGILFLLILFDWMERRSSQARQQRFRETLQRLDEDRARSTRKLYEDNLDSARRKDADRMMLSRQAFLDLADNQKAEAEVRRWREQDRLIKRTRDEQDQGQG